jgi:hypothetical protein
MEPQEPKVVINALANTEPGEVPVLKDDVDLIAAVECTREVDKFRDLELLGERIAGEKGMSVSIAQESMAVLTDFITEDRPLAYFTQTPTRTNLKAALEAIEQERAGLLKTIGTKVHTAFIVAVDKIDKVLTWITTSAQDVEKLTPAAVAIAKKVVTADAKLFLDGFTWKAPVESADDLTVAKNTIEGAIRKNMSAYQKAFYDTLLSGNKYPFASYLVASDPHAVALFARMSDVYAKVCLDLKIDGLHSQKINTSEVMSFLKDFDAFEKELTGVDAESFTQTEASALLKQVSEGTSFYTKAHTRVQLENVAKIIADNLENIDPRDEESLKDVYLKNVEILRGLSSASYIYAKLCLNHVYLLKAIITADKKVADFWRDVFESAIKASKDITKGAISFIRIAINKL